MKSFYIKWLSIIIISCLGIAVYSNTFACSFHFDDFLFIVDNSFIRNIHNLQNIWEFYPSRFITYLSIALNYHFNGLAVPGYHLVNLAIHLVTAMLVWRLVLLTLSTPAMEENEITPHAQWIALLAGLVFVSQPVQTEAVTYIWQRAACIATLFYLATLTLYIKSRLLFFHAKSSWKFYYICSLLTAIMAMFTKQTVITLPLMVLLYEFSFLKTKKRLDWKYLIPFLLTLLIIPLTMLLTHSEKAQYIQGYVEVPGGLSPMQYILTEFRVMVTYIRLAFLPLHQTIDYDYHISKSILELPTLLSFLFLIIVLFSAQRLFSKYRLISFSILWFFLTALPEAMPYPVKDVIFEYRLYLPLVGYSMFLVSSGYYILGKNNLKTMVFVLSMIIIFYSVLTYQRNKIWKDEITLWGDAIQKSPHKARPYNIRGAAYFSQKNAAQAISDLNKAVAIDPNFAQVYINRGIAYALLNNFSEAISNYNKAIEINPNDTYAYYNRGNAYYSQGKFTQAILDYSEVIEKSSNITLAYNNRAIAYYQLKQYDKAWEDVHKAEELGVAVYPGLINALKHIRN